MQNHFIRVQATNKLVNAFEGADGKERADEIAAIHNKAFPQDAWIVESEEA